MRFNVNLVVFLLNKVSFRNDSLLLFDTLLKTFTPHVPGCTYVSPECSRVLLDRQGHSVARSKNYPFPELDGTL